MSKKVLVLTYWGYKEALISNFTIPYLKVLHEVDKDMKLFLFTLNKKEQQLSPEEIVQANKSLGKFNTQLLAYNFNKFGIKTLIKTAFLMPKLWWFIRKNKITHIHSFCTTAGAFGYILKLFSRVTFILDSFEPHAESMVESNTWKEGGMAHKLLFYLEGKQANAADYVISLTEEMRVYAKKKYDVTIKNFYVKPSCIDTSKFDNPLFVKNPNYLKKLNLEDKIIGLYAGKFGGLYLEGEVFDLIKAAYNKWGEQFQMLILGNAKDEYIQTKLVERNIPAHVIHKSFVATEDLPYYLGMADFALTPVKPTQSKRYCSPIKNGEYWTIGLPVIITKDISDDSDIIQSKNIGYVLQALSNKEYTRAIDWVDEFLARPDKQTIKEEIRALGINHRSINNAKRIYAEIYNQ